MTTTVGQRIRQLRNLKGWSQEGLAATAQMKVDTLIDLENGHRATRPSTLKKLAEALEVDLRSLLDLPLRPAPQPSNGASNAAALEHQLDELVRSSPAPMIDPGRYLRHLRHRIAVLEDSGNSQGAIELIKKNIKSFCVHTEVYSTMMVAEDDREKILRFSCSAAMDTSILRYAEDDEWRLLLSTMGEAAKSSDKKFIRVIFFDFTRRYSKVERFTIKNIITEHLRNMVSVALCPLGKLSSSENEKKNMALFGRHGLLAATDQVAWDLSFTSGNSEVMRAVDKHEAFLERARCVFLPGDEARVSHTLDEIITAEESSLPNLPN
jgi:transcriptional regulator with XRE-family HTH domain